MEFEYQKEFRIILYNREIEPKIIQIGSLKDYADVFHVDALDTMGITLHNKN